MHFDQISCADKRKVCIPIAVQSCVDAASALPRDVTHTYSTT